jgi:hypothetical protein
MRSRQDSAPASAPLPQTARTEDHRMSPIEKERRNLPLPELTTEVRDVVMVVPQQAEKCGVWGSCRDDKGNVFHHVMTACTS